MLRPHFQTVKWQPLEAVFFFCVAALSIGLLATSHYVLALVPGLAILAMLFLAKAPSIGYYLIIFLIPFGAYRGLSVTYQFLKIHWILALWLIILVALQFIFRKKVSVSLRSSLWPWFSILFFISLISSLLSPYPETSFPNLYLLFVSYLFFALNLVLLSREAFSKTLPKVLVISVAVSAFLAVAGMVLRLPAFARGMSTAMTRGVGASLDPNNLSLMIIFTLPLVVHWFLSARSLGEKAFAVLLFCVDIAGIVVTYSRGGALILVITLLLIFFEHIGKFRPRYFGFVTIFAAMFIVLTIVVVPSSYWERQKKVTSVGEDRALSRRISYLYVGWKAFKERPLFGSGPNTFKEIYATSDYALQFGQEEEELKRYAHNSYLEYLVGMGILGFTGFLVILWLALRNLSAAKRNFRIKGRKEMLSVVGAYQISFVSLLFYLLIYSDIFHKYLIVALALSQAALNLSQGEDAESDGSPVPDL